MSAIRARKEAAMRLGLAIGVRHRQLLMASGDPEAVQAASMELGQVLNDNLEFITWALKTLGGLTPPPPEPVRKGTLQ